MTGEATPSSRSTRSLPTEAASPFPLRYRVGDIKSRLGLESAEAYDKWRQGRWTEAIKGQEAITKIQTAGRGKLARKNLALGPARDSRPADGGAPRAAPAQAGPYMC